MGLWGKYLVYARYAGLQVQFGVIRCISDLQRPSLYLENWTWSEMKQNLFLLLFHLVVSYWLYLLLPSLCFVQTRL